MPFDNLDLIPIKEAEYITSGVSMDTFPEDCHPEFMLAGRSNVGKSSFINMTLNRKNLARTSGKPGKTQTMNFFFINQEFYFVDVPGYGYASVSESKKQAFGRMLEDYLKNRKSLKCIFLLFDGRIGPTADDITMFQYVKSFQHDVCLIATKMDKLNQSEKAKLKKMIEQKLPLDTHDKIIYTSVITKKGLQEVHNVLKEYLN